MRKSLVFLCVCLLGGALVFRHKRPSFSPAPDYFSLSEFDSPDTPGSGSMIDKHLVRGLNRARHILGSAIRVNSGYRTPAQNDRVGGVSNSAHLRGLAADITPTVATLDELLDAVRSAGFRRIGIYRSRNFLHVDIDSTKIHQSEWEI